MHKIQQLTLPSVAIGAPDEMYLRASERDVYYPDGQGKIIFVGRSAVSGDTFFNSLSVGRWKEFCDLKDLSLVLAGRGNFLIRFGLHRLGHSHRWLQQQEVKLARNKSVTIPLPFWPDLIDGMLYYEITSFGAGEITEASFSTTTRPLQEVKLGIVITHFNRKNYVLPAIKRLREGLLSDPHFKNKIELTVVDNSQNITKEEARGITLIPNQNLGGSGGFMRGLMHLEDEGSFTHCLFMDDDASTEIESIRRTYALLSFSKAKKFAVSGSMLRENDKHLLHEKGAILDDYCRPLKHGMDMRHVHELLHAEVIDQVPDYGGWWFFGFKLKDVKAYAFPFFVKGDDVAFPIMNNLLICTMNGISTWGEEFSFKSSPLSRYLEVRCHTMLQLTQRNSSTRMLFKVLKFDFMAPLFSYNYATAQAVSLAISHISQGPAFWRQNIDMVAVRNEINAIPSQEKMQSFDIQSLKTCAPPRENIIRHILTNLTLGGNLLPDFLLQSNKVVIQPKWYHGAGAQTFGFKRVLYWHEPTRSGYLVSINRTRFFKLYFTFIMRLIWLRLNYSRVKADQIDGVAQLTRREFWEKIYKLRPIPANNTAKKALRSAAPPKTIITKRS